MSRILPALVALPLVAAFGLAEGLWSNRWQSAGAAEQAAARLKELPLSVGDWQAEEREFDARQAEKAELTGHTWRRYVNQKTGAAVSVLLVCGRAGPVALHPPDVCYQGAGYRLTAPQARRDVPAEGVPAAFWVGQFQKDGPLPEPLRIYWAWSADGAWAAPDNPRVTFARSPALHKLYVIRDLPRVDEPAEQGPELEFLRDFLPQLRDRLFPAPA